MADVDPIPKGYRQLPPYLIVAGAARAIDFCKSAFGAAERMHLGGSVGRIGRAAAPAKGQGA